MSMDKEKLSGLLTLNQLALLPEEEQRILSFFDDMEKREAEHLPEDMSGVEPMVHVVSMTNVLREDECIQPFSRDELLEGAPEQTDGYWQVPRLVE